MAVPAIATVAGLAYLSGRWRLPVDFHSIRALTSALRFADKKEKQDRYNSFYTVEENAQNPKTADKHFLLYEDQSYTFKQFYDIVLAYAGWLHSTLHVVQGEVVAINFMNGPEILFLAVALWSLGATPALMNYNLVGDPLAHSLRTSSARLMIVEPEVAEKVLDDDTKEKLSSSTFRNNQFPFEVVVLGKDLQTSVKHFKPYRAPDSTRSGLRGRDPAVLISTSGTTGLPKQAIVPAYRIVAGGYLPFANAGLRSVTSRQPDVYYTAMPLYHGTAFITAFSACMAGACTLAVGRKFSTSNFWVDVRRHQATAILYVGEILRYLMTVPPQPDDRNHKVRLAFGNGLRPDVWRRFKSRFGIETVVEFYSATEGTFATINRNRNDFSDGAVGQYGLISGFIASRTLVIVKMNWETYELLRDPKTGLCIKAATNEPGELLAKLDPQDPHASFAGYYNNKKATDEKILRDVLVKGDAYWRTGDALRWDAEGRLWFSDRLGDTFRWKSENVSTAEVGQVVGQHPAVVEANVYGVSVPGYEGRAGCAAILFKDSALETGQDESAVKADVLESLATHSKKSLQKASVPVFLRVVKEMAVTGNHKTLKHVFRNQGIDLQAIQKTGSGDQLYWLPPGAESYVEFGQEQWTTLNAGKARL